MSTLLRLLNFRSRTLKVGHVALFVLSAAVWSLLPACSGGQVRIHDSAALPEESVEKSDITSAAWAWAEAMTDSMSLRERVGQLFMPAVYARSDSYSMRKVCEYASGMHVGGLILLRGDLHSTAAIADTLAAISRDEGLGSGMFVALDAETGLGMRLEDAPVFPWNSRLDPKVDERTLFDYGREVARECRLAGINMVLGPVLDVDRSSPGKRRSTMWLRSLGGDPQRVAELSVAYARGLESGGVISVAKHFPGHGSTSTDTHKSMASITTTDEELWSKDLYPFRRYVESGLSGVIVGHLWVEAVDSVSRPASFSPAVISGLLRGRLGFDGLVLTDALNMEGALGYTATDAIEAGADIILAPADTRREIENVVAAISLGRLSEETVSARCRRILFYKYIFGIPAGIRGGRGLSKPALRSEVSEGSGKLLEQLEGSR